MLKIFVEEEYGYRHWLWTYPGTVEELISDWKAGRGPFFYFDPSRGTYQGEMKDLRDIFEGDDQDAFWDFLHETEDSADAFVHTHEVEDTYLVIGDRRLEESPVYHHPHWKGVRVKCPKCSQRNVFENPEIEHTISCWSCGEEFELPRS